MKKRLVSTPSQEADFESVAAPLSVRARNTLKKLHVADVEALLNLTHYDLLQAWACGDKTIREIEAFQERLAPGRKRKKTKKTKKVFSFKGKFEIVFVAVRKILSVRSNHILNEAGITGFNDFMNADMKQLIVYNNCGVATIRELLSVQSRLIEFIGRVASDTPRALLEAPCLWGNNSSSPSLLFYIDMKNPAAWLLQWIKGIARSDKHAEAFLLRKGMTGDPVITLKDVGDRLGGLTRERIRQMVDEVQQKIAEPQQQLRLLPFIETTVDMVNKAEGYMHIGELTKIALCRGRKKKRLSYAENLIRFFTTLAVWKDAGLVLDSGGFISLQDPAAFS